MADLETNDDTNANDAFDAIAKQSEAAESKAIETGIFLSRCELRPFFGSHARTSHVQI